MMDVTRIPSPCYVMEEKLLRKNLSLLKQVADQAGVGICHVEIFSDFP